MPQYWEQRSILDQFTPDSNQMTQSWAQRSGFITNDWSPVSNGDGRNCPIIQHPIPMVPHTTSNGVHSTTHSEFKNSSVQSSLHACCSNSLDTKYIGEEMPNSLHPIILTIGHYSLKSHAFSPKSLMQSVEQMHLHT
ncbi:hypothetical protein O181_021608 [Austropuccinia psidii MF-1]|uniref:Uncharacterized protein n=1 Tax=Austropuccinia psidii MF-1 TaxID=1389203 RepID=A0A9Q3CDN7_9BASI|nr:hypothetical protein [Austropuccinia psidii MF-1]